METGAERGRILSAPVSCNNERHPFMSPEEIRQLRRDLDLPQADFAARLGLRQASSVCEWETGKRKPSSEMLSRLRNLEKRKESEPRMPRSAIGRPRCFTQEEEDRALDLHLSGISKANLEKIFQCTTNTIRRACEASAARNGIYLPAEDHFALGIEQEREVIALYDAGWTTHTVALQMGIGHTTVSAILDRHGRKMRTSVESRTLRGTDRRYRLHETAFDDAENNPAAAYFVGLLMADGCVSRGKDGKRHPAIQLHLQRRDVAIIESFRSFLGSNHPITFRDNLCNGKMHPQARFSVNSARLAAALARYGVVPQKTVTAQLIGLEMNPHAWRGCIDGDGSICFARANNLPLLCLVGSRFLLAQFREFVLSIESRTKAKVRQGNGNVWQFAISGCYAQEVIRVLYEGAPVALQRKAENATRALAWKPRPNGRRRSDAG